MQTLSMSLGTWRPTGISLWPSFISNIYSPLADTIKRYILEYHVYADDAQLRLAFKTDCPDKMIECKTTIKQCVRDIDDWMVINKLKRNQVKTEVVLITLRYRPRPSLEPFQIGKMIVVPSSSARYLGVIFDKCFNFSWELHKINLQVFSLSHNKYRLCDCEIGSLQFSTIRSSTTSHFKTAIYSKHRGLSCHTH